MNADRSPAERAVSLAIRSVCRLIVSRRVRVHVEGIEHLPVRGPVVIAARHVHHFYDGAVLLAVSPRPLLLLVALDWAPNAVIRRLMEQACRAARWPVVLRGERLQQDGQQVGDGAQRSPGAYGASELLPFLRRASAETVAQLRRGEAVVVFPEGYPNIDPHANPKGGGRGFLPFRPGFVRLAARAERQGAAPVAIVPAGFRYQRGRRITVHFGAPLYLSGIPAAEAVRRVEQQVQALSGERRLEKPRRR